MRIFPTKRTVKRWAIGAAILVAIALIANGFMAWLTEHRLQTRIAAIRAAGDPASIADLAPKPIPDYQNAAFILERLDPQLKAFSRDYARFYDSPIGKEYEQAEDRGEPPTADQIAAIRATVDKYPELDRGLAKAAACDSYASRTDFSLSHSQFVEALTQRMHIIRAAQRFLQWRMIVLIAGRSPTDAVERGLQVLRLAKLYESEPGLIDLLVTYAVRCIASQALYDALVAGEISPEVHHEIDQELARQEDSQRMTRAMTQERAFSFSMIEQARDEARPTWWVHMVGWPITSFYIGSIDFYDHMINSVARPWYQVRDEFGSFQYPNGIWTPHPSPKQFKTWDDLMRSSLGATLRSNARSEALTRSLRIFNALRQYAEQNGHEASGLADVPLPKEATIDPFSGEPLKLKHTDDGWIVYSVMENGVDDGGDFIDLKDYGLAPTRYRATQKHE